MTPPNKTAVVGAGHLGTSHLAKMAADPDAELVAVVDTDGDKRQKAIDKNGIRGVPALRELAGQVEAVVIATPTSTHVEVGLEALELGMHVLVEKPIAPSTAGAERLV